MKTVTTIILSALLISLSVCHIGCGQQGETTAEGHRRHKRNVRLNQEAMQHDIDVLLMSDKPSKLSPRHIR